MGQRLCPASSTVKKSKMLNNLHLIGLILLITHYLNPNNVFIKWPTDNEKIKPSRVV